MIQQVTIEKFSEPAITLTASDAAGFDARLLELVPRWASLAMGLKPFLVLVTNESAQTVVAYSIVFMATPPNGQYDRTVLQFKYPEAAAGRDGESPFGRGREIARGEQRVVGLEFELMPDVDNNWLVAYAAMQRQRFKDAVRLDIAVDAVVFSDGTLIGPDTSGLADHFSSYLSASQNLYRRIVGRIDAGSSVADIFAELDAESRSTVDEPPLAGLDSISYNAEARGDARRHRSRFGDAAMRDLFSRAIRTSPFVVRRASRK